MSIDIPNYTLIKPLGHGAMADVWLAEHKIHKRKAAIKILKPSALTDADTERLFEREGQVLAGFRDDNIVAIYDINRIGNLAYIVMEYLPGGTLLERMQRAPIRVGEAIGLIVQLAKAIGAAHRLDIIHRDLKPANIMMRDETTPVLTDFGAVRVLNRSTIYGKDGGIVGTPAYMSPEQITGGQLDARSDLYALGVLFFELLTGRLPYPGGNINEIASQHVFAPIPMLPVELTMLQPILARLLCKQPYERYSDAQQLIDALRHCYLSEEALRRQIGYAATSAAWSSQLRALGFVLDTEQKSEIRIAQGEYLQQTSAAQAVESIDAARRGSASESGTTSASDGGSASTPPPAPKGPAASTWSTGGRRAKLLGSAAALGVLALLFMLWPKHNGHGHPQFSIDLPAWDEKGEFRPVRTNMNEKLVDNSGLLFPHKAHLGQVSTGPDKRLLSCATCHVADADKTGFKPVSFEAQCHECHRLDFDPSLPDRELSHTDFAEAIRRLNEFYAKLAIEGRYNGQALPNAKPELQRWLAKKTKEATEQLVMSRCITCHRVTKPGAAPETPYVFAPVHVTNRWFSQASFSHAKHAAAECEDCHRAAQSAVSSEVLIPDISNCRACHLGKTAASNLNSDCSACHGSKQFSSD